MAATVIATAGTNAIPANPSTTGITVTHSFSLVNGDILVAFVAMGDDDPSAFTSTSGGTWSNDVTNLFASSSIGNDIAIGVLWRVVTNAAGEPSTYTFLATGATAQKTLVAQVIQVRGGDTSNVLDGNGYAARGTNDFTPTHSNYTTAVNNSLLLIAHAASMTDGTTGKSAGKPSTATSLTSPSSQYQQDTAATAGFDIFIESAYQTTTTLGSQTIDSWTGSPDDSASEWAIATFAVREKPPTIYTKTGIAYSEFKASGADVAIRAETGLAKTGSPESYATMVLADTPVAYYRMNDASGNPQDSSGNARHITSTTGTPDYSLPGPLAIDSGIRLDGGEYFVRSSVVSTATNNFTIEGWFKIEAVTQQDEVLVHNGDSASNGWGIVVNDTGTLQFLAGGVSFGPDSATLINHGKWVHIAVVRRAGAWEYWFNGVFDKNSGGTNAPNTPTTELRINSDSVQPVYAHVALYETALTGTRIQQHYQASRGMGGSGAKQVTKTYEKSGLAKTDDMVASGARNHALGRSGRAEIDDMKASGTYVHEVAKAGTAILRPHAYPSFFPTTALLDPFSGADEDPVATNWSGPTMAGDQQMRRVSSALRKQTASGYGNSWYDVVSYGQDQEAFATIATEPPAGSSVSVFARITNPNTHNGVGGVQAVQVALWNGGGVSIYKFDNGWSQLASGGITFTDGDKIGIRCIGPRIEGWHYASGTWSLVLVAEDTNPHGGYIGVETGSSEGAVLDDFSGGDLIVSQAGESQVIYSKSGGSSSDFVGSGASETPIATRMAQVAWAVLYVPRSVVAAYTKTGAGKSDFAASGTDAITYVEAGAAVSEFTASGTRQKDSSRTGAGISAFSASGADVAIRAETGAGVSPFSASGTDVAIRVETGAGISSFVASGTRAKTAARTGAGISSFVASGSDVAIRAETGAGISPFVASGADVAIRVETGAGISPRTGGGADVATRVETGAGISPFVASGASVPVQQNAGTAISPFTASGTKAKTALRTGAAVSAFTGSAADAVVFAETGAGTAPFSASGASSRAATNIKTGAGVSDFVASGADADTFVETGTATSDNFVAGSVDTDIYFDTGAGIADFTASGTRATATAETGLAESEFTGSGADAVVYVESGAAVLDNLIAAGVETDVQANTGSAVAEFTASGADATAYVETGAALASFTASGADALVFAEAGTAIAPFTAAGAEEEIGTHSGTAIAPFVASGADVATYVKSGTAVSEFTGSAARESIYAEASTAISPFSASGLYEQNYLRAGTGILDFTASGTSEKTGGATYDKTGAGAADFTASGSDASLFAETGAGIAPFAASGSRQKSGDKTGTAISAFFASGSDEDIFQETGAAVSPFSGSGDAYQAQINAGFAVSEFTASGADAATYVEEGLAASALAASGADATTYVESGAAISDFVASGDAYQAQANAGTAIADFTGSGADATTYVESGLAVSDFTALGDAYQAQANAGTAISEFTGSGADAVTYIEAGTAESVFSASGLRATALSRTGTGILEFTGTGVSQLLGAPIEKTGAGVLDFTASGKGLIPYYLRPDGDLATGTWHDTPLYEKVDETIADLGDYITSGLSPLSPDITELSLTDPGFVPDRDDCHTLRYIISKDSAGGDSEQLTVRLMQGAVEITSWTHEVGDTPVLYEQLLTPSEAANITDYTDLRIRLEAVKI